MTGISDVFRSAKNVLHHVNWLFVCALNVLPENFSNQIRILFPTWLVVTQQITCPQPKVPDPRPTIRQSRVDGVKQSTTVIAYHN